MTDKLLFMPYDSRYSRQIIVKTFQNGFSMQTRNLKLVIFTCVAIFVFPATAFAQTPAKLLQEIAAKLKATGSAAVLVDYVNWDSAFQNVDPRQKDQLNVQTPDALREYYRQLLTNPEKFLRQQIEGRLEELPPDQRESAKQKFEAALVEARAKLAESKLQFKESQYTVGEETITGDQAGVKLETVYKGTPKSDTIRFVKINGKWYLSSVRNIGSEQ